MNAPTLIIFIDSFPFLFLGKTQFLSSFPLQYQVTPGFGYSINLQAVIFTGKTPDELGYFCEWSYDPARSKFRNWKGLCSLINPVKNIYYIDRIFHRIIGKFTGPIGNIPFAYLPFLQKVPADVFQNSFQGKSMFHDFPEIKLASFQKYKHLPCGESDKSVFEETLCLIDEYRCIVATFVGLDGIAHVFGMDSLEYQKRIQELDAWIFALTDKFLGKNPGGSVAIVSDHGMAPVYSGVSIDIEKKFGKPDPQKYIYFVDSTLLRVWTCNDTISKEIKNYLHELTSGQLITDEERRAFGLTNPSIGSLIFQINENMLFNPSFWGRGLSKAMHGYHPKLESQKGICLISRGKDNFENSKPIIKENKTVDLYVILHDLLAGTYNA
jgi:hypothetical protein